MQLNHCLSGEIIALNTHTGKEQRSQISYLSFHLKKKKRKNQTQNMPKEGNNKEQKSIQMRTNKKQLGKKHYTQKVTLLKKKIYKIDKTLARLNKERGKEEKTDTDYKFGE